MLEQETVSGCGISWAICKSAPRSSHITTPAPHHSVLKAHYNLQHQHRLSQRVDFTISNDSVPRLLTFLHPCTSCAVGSSAKYQYKQANNIYKAKIKNRIKGTLCAGACMGQKIRNIPEFTTQHINSPSKNSKRVAP